MRNGPFSINLLESVLAELIPFNYHGHAYHYTSFEGAKGICINGEMWLKRIDLLDDQDEG